MKIKDRIREINKIREDLLNELKALQESCTHEEYHIGTYSWRIGCYDQKRICLECGHILTDPSKEELEDFNNENDELNKEYIEKRRLEKENNKDPNIVYVETNLRIGQGTKIYKREFDLEDLKSLHYHGY